MKRFGWLASAVALGCVVWQPAAAQSVNRCLIDGKQVYQQGPCPTGAQQSKVRVFAGGEVAPPPSKPAPVAEARPQEPAAPAPVDARPVKSALEHEADLCLDWYRGMLRDPRSAYYTDANKQGRVLTIDVKATNGFGGFVTKLASCEIKDGSIDDGWTRIHAERKGWRP